MRTPMVRDREPGGEEKENREGGKTITRKKQDNDDRTRTTDSVDKTRARAHRRDHCHHPQRGPQDRPERYRERVRSEEEGARKEGRRRRQDLEREERERKGKQSREQPMKPVQLRGRDKAIRLETGHHPTQCPR